MISVLVLASRYLQIIQICPKGHGLNFFFYHEHLGYYSKHSKIFTCVINIY